MGRMAGGYITVNSVKIAVRGTWLKDGASLHFGDVLAELKEGQEVIVKYKVSEKWGPLALEIIAEEVRYVRG